jgi:hypothetical protein
VPVRLESRSETVPQKDNFLSETQRRDTKYSQRLSVTVGIVMLGLVSSLLINLPTRILTFNALGSPLSLQISGRYVLVALIVGLTCTGTDSLIRIHPMAERRQLRGTFSMWTISALMVLLATLALPHAPNRVLWVVGIALVGILLALSMIAEYHTIDPADPRFGVSQVFLNVLTYALALIMFVIVYGAKSRSLLSATTLLVVAALLSLERLRVTGYEISAISPYALVTGMVIGESVWALNYSRLPGLVGGLLLLLSFHVITGLAYQHLVSGVKTRVLVEYAIIVIVGLALVLHFSV